MSSSSASHPANFAGFALVALIVTGIGGHVLAAPGEVLSHQKISDTEGSFAGPLADIDNFGWSVAFLGDLDGDGVGDLAVGAVGDHIGLSKLGAVWILFLNPDGTVKAQQKINTTEGGFLGALDSGDGFGAAVAHLGDLDGDSVGDLAVGARGDDDGGPSRGAVWVLFLNRDGTVKAQQKISSTRGNFGGGLDDTDQFGYALAALDDFDGDGVGDLAVGAFPDDDGGIDRGAVWMLFLNADGTVKSHQKISDTQGNFTGTLDHFDNFGSEVVGLEDLDGDGVSDLAVAAAADDDGGNARGAVWVLFLNPDGTVKSHQKISATQGGFNGELDDVDLFGSSLASPGDLDGDDVDDLVVGARGDDDGGFAVGAAWVLFLNTDGTVKAHRKISATQGNFSGTLTSGDDFGSSAASLGDFDGDGVGDVSVGARFDTDGGDDQFADRGAVWILFLDGVPSMPLDPVALLADLIVQVVSLDLPHGIENSLLAKLNTASMILGDLQASNDHAAANRLGAFIRQVEAQYKKNISSTDGDALIESAEQIIDLLTENLRITRPGFRRRLFSPGRRLGSNPQEPE